MPLYNVSIDDASPMISYSGAWVDTNTSDTSFQRYLNSTFHATNQNGAAAQVIFNGSAVYVYGAKRSNHDQYSVNLDGSSQFFNGFSAQDQFQQLLFSAKSLNANQHTLTVTDASTRSDRPALDIDFVVITVGDGDASTSFTGATWDDQAQNITYGSGWSNGQSNTFYLNHTSHIANTSGATATIPFFGNAVSLFGVTSTNHGKYSVRVDGGRPRNFTGQIVSNSSTSAIQRTQNLLYFASGLGHMNHTLSLTNTDTTGRLLDLDFVTATTWTPHSLSTTSKTNIGAIVGGVVGGVAVLVLAALAIWLWIRRRKRVRYEVTLEKNAQDVIPFSPEQEPDAESAATGAGGAVVPSSSRAKPAASPMPAPSAHVDSELPPPDYAQVLEARRARAGSPTAPSSSANAETGSSTAASDTRAAVPAISALQSGKRPLAVADPKH